MVAVFNVLTSEKELDQINQNKCLFTFTQTKFPYSRSTNGKTHCTLTLESGEVFTHANSICKYASELAEDNLHSEDLAVDEWIEWEETKLMPMLTASLQSKDFSSVQTLLQQVNASFKDHQYLVNNCLSLADIVVGVTLKTTLQLLQANKSDEQMEDIKQYVDLLYKLDCFQQQQGTTGPVVTKLAENVLAGESYDSLLSILGTLFTEAVTSAFPALVGAQAEVTRATDAKFGDYQCNNAMGIFKKLKSTGVQTFKSPRDVSASIIEHLPKNPVITKCEVAGPGFINIFLSQEFVQKRLKYSLTNGVKSTPCKPKRILIDFSSPNIAKDMHVGHLRSTIIGDAMCRILEFQGHTVFRTNHVGDWGTQFGMLICHLMDAFPTWEAEMPDISDLTALYKDAKGRFDEDEEFKARAKNGVVKLQSGDELSRRVWKVLCDISRKEFQKVYDRLGVKLEEYGESFYNQYIPPVIDILKGKHPKEFTDKDLTEDSDGALVVFTKEFKQPLMMVKRDGSYLYDSTDVAAMWYRFHHVKADWVIIYTDYTQADHFKLLFSASRMAGLLQDGAEHNYKHRVNHIGFGTVNGEDGKRFKTRSGETVRLVSLLDEAKERMKKELIKRIEAKTTTLPMSEVDKAAEQIGYGAVKYFDLRQKPASGYIFSYDRMLSTEGDTAVYLMFAYARLSSIIRKSNKKIANILPVNETALVHPNEWALGVELLNFGDVLNFINKDLLTNRLCNYLYNIADKVQSFVTTCRVLGVDEEDSRLLLCEATRNTMKVCFNLLGMEPLEQI